MPDYSPNETVDIFLILGECRRNYRRAAVLYQRRFSLRQHPSHTAIRKIEMRSWKGNLRRKRRKYNDYMNDYAMNVNFRTVFLVQFRTVIAMVHLNPHVSLHEIQHTLGIPKSTARRYLKAAAFHPYHISLNQALTENDHEKRVLFCQWALQQIQHDQHFFKYVLFSDEATFHND